jgi:hypothetical protein
MGSVNVGQPDDSDALLTLSEDDDDVTKLTVNPNSLNSFQKRVVAASSQQNGSNIENEDGDVFSNGDPFDNMTDSDAPAVIARTSV